MIQPAKVQKNTHIRKKTNTFFEKIGFYLILFCFSVSSAYPQHILCISSADWKGETVTQSHYHIKKCVE